MGFQCRLFYLHPRLEGASTEPESFVFRIDNFSRNSDQEFSRVDIVIGTEVCDVYP